MEFSNFTDLNLSWVNPDLLENETVSTDEDNPYKGIIDKLQFSMTIIGFLGNVIVYITLSKNGHMFTSPTILRLLKNQSTADSIVCLIGSIFVMQPPMWTTSNEKLSAFFCMVGTFSSIHSTKRLNRNSSFSPLTGTVNGFTEFSEFYKSNDA